MNSLIVVSSGWSIANATTPAMRSGEIWYVSYTLPKRDDVVARVAGERQAARTAARQAAKATREREHAEAAARAKGRSP